MQNFLHIFFTFFKLGWLGFGGPAAHISLFHTVFVDKLNWLDDTTFGKYNALANALPGPGSSQLGFSIGVHRGGKLGGLAAFLGFTLPSMVIMLCLALGASYFEFLQWPVVQQTFTLFVTVIVADAVWQMGKKFCVNWQLVVVTLVATALVLWQPQVMLLVIVGAALLGQLPFIHSSATTSTAPTAAPVRKSPFKMILPLAIAVIGLLGLAQLPYVFPDNHFLKIAAIHLETGYQVFGGGHVMLPLMKETLVSPGFIDIESFTNGYGVAQLIPGPLFTFAAFTGASTVPDQALLAGVTTTLAIFLPGLLLMYVCLPILDAVSHAQWFKRALTAINAAVTGILLSALCMILYLACMQHGDFMSTQAFLTLIFWAGGLIIHFKFKSIWLTLGYCLATILCMFGVVG